MSYHAKIIGISGIERFLARDGGETAEKKRARRFRSDEAARAAARMHVAVFAPVVQRSMRYDAVPADAGEQLDQQQEGLS